MLTRICVLVSGGGTNLQALIDAQKNGIIKSGEITLVIASKPGVYALERAEKAGIKTAVCERKAFADKKAFDDALLKMLEENGTELIVLAGFMCILGKEFTDKYPERIINIHPSLIPSFCGEGFYGLHVHEAALSYGVKVTGATVHFVNEIPDGGRIIMQKAVYIEEGDTPEILQKRVMEQAEWEIMPLACEKVAADIASKKS